MVETSLILEGGSDIETEGGVTIILEGEYMTGVGEGFITESGILTRMAKTVRSLSGGF